MSFDTRIRKLEEHAPPPVCLGCGFPERSTRAVILREDVDKECRRCETCGRRLSPRGTPMVNWWQMHLSRRGR